MWHLSCAGQRITGDMESRLRHVMQETQAQIWWRNKLQIPEEYHCKVSWSVYQGHKRSTPSWLQTWSVKFGADILPTRKNLVRRGHGEHHECPCCGEPNENAKHLFLCFDPEMSKAFDDEMDKLSDFLQLTTNSIIKKHLLATLSWFRAGSDPERTVTANPQSTNSVSAQAAHHQCNIGLLATLNGIWHKDWLAAQTTHLRQIRSRSSARVWLIRFSNLCQKMVHTLWKTRNAAIHQREESDNNKKRHEELDDKVAEIFRSIPNLRLLPPSDAAYFRRGEERITRYRLNRKELWIEDAARIRDAFFDSLDAQSASFLNYFGSIAL